MFLPDLAPLTQQQNINQQQIISLLKQTKLALVQIQQTLKEINKQCLKSKTKKVLSLPEEPLPLTANS